MTKLHIDQVMISSVYFSQNRQSIERKIHCVQGVNFSTNLGVTICKCTCSIGLLEIM
jgi:hypothetical protein